MLYTHPEILMMALTVQPQFSHKMIKILLLKLGLFSGWTKCRLVLLPVSAVLQAVEERLLFSYEQTLTYTEV